MQVELSLFVLGYPYCHVPRTVVAIRSVRLTRGDYLRPVVLRSQTSNLSRDVCRFDLAPQQVSSVSQRRCLRLDLVAPLDMFQLDLEGRAILDE